MASIRVFIYFLIVSFAFVSCKEHVSNFEKIDSKDSLPDVLVKEVFTNYSDSGKVKMKLSAPNLINYEVEEVKYTEFQDGVKAYFYNDQDKIESSLSADFAKHNSKEDIWEYRGNVVIINNLSDTLRTYLLFANRKTEELYTDTTVTIVTHEHYRHRGEGFNSNFDFTDFTFEIFTSEYIGQ